MSSNECTRLGGGVALALAMSAAAAAVDLAALEVVPQRGQSAEQARRDRYECHNWAVEETGVTPAAVPREEERSESRRGERAAVGAAAGAGIGGLVRAVLGEDPAEGLLAGAAIGAIVGAASAPRAAGEDPLDAGTSEYLRALSACLEGRGYQVNLPETGGPPAAELVAGLNSGR
jgi:hypothetical protein